MLCGCYSLRVGVAALTFAGCVALSARVLFGADASAFLNAALAGNMAPVVWIWSAVVVVGLWQTIAGLNAALEHSEPIRPVSLAWSTAAIWLATYYLPHAYHPSDFTPLNWTWLQAILIAWVAEHIANIWLNLRWLFNPRRRPTPVPALSVPELPKPMMTRRIVVEESYYGGEVQVRTWETPPSPPPSVARPYVPLIKHDGRALPPLPALPSSPLIRSRVP